MSLARLKQTDADLELCKKEFDELIQKMNRGVEVEESRVKQLRDKNKVLKVLVQDKIEDEFDDPKDYLKSRVKDIFFRNVRVRTEHSESKEREKKKLH